MERGGEEEEEEVQEEEEQEEEDSDGLVSERLHSDLRQGLLLGSEEVFDNAEQGSGEHLRGLERVCLVLGEPQGTDPEAQDPGNSGVEEASQEPIESEDVFASEAENMNERWEDLVVEPEELPEPADVASTLNETTWTPAVDGVALGHRTVASGDTGDTDPQPDDDLVPEGSQGDQRELVETDNNIAESGPNMVFFIQVSSVWLDLRRDHQQHHHHHHHHPHHCLHRGDAGCSPSTRWFLFHVCSVVFRRLRHFAADTSLHRFTASHRDRHACL